MYLRSSTRQRLSRLGHILTLTVTGTIVFAPKLDPAEFTAMFARWFI